MSNTECAIAKALVLRIASGDSEAETIMINRYQKGLLFMLRHRSGNLALAEDISQETWRIVIEKLRANQIKKPESLAAFIVQTGKNQLLMAYRKSKNKEQDKEQFVIDQAVDQQAPPHERIEQAHRAEHVRRLLGELSIDRDREILRRFYLLEQPKVQICRDLSIDNNHFDRVIYRAKLRFKELIEQTYETI